MNSVVLGMGMRGSSLKDELYFKPNLEAVFEYGFATNSGFTQDYELFVRMQEGSTVDLTPYVTLDKYYVEDVPTGKVVSFVATMKLPEEIEEPGFHEIQIGAAETQTLNGGGQFGVKTASYARVIIIVLHDEPYIQWGFVAPNANINDEVTFNFITQNLCKNPLNVQGKVDIYNKEDRLVGSVRTPRVTVQPTEKNEKDIIATMSTFGIEPAAYTAKAEITYEGKTEYAESDFLIGKKTLEILDYTKEAVTESINKFFVRVQSGWNDEMEDVYAEIDVFKTLDGPSLASAKTVTEKLLPWQTLDLQAYLDTSGLEEGDYTMRLKVHYENELKVETGVLEITEGAGTEVVEDIPETDEGRISIAVVLMIIIIALLVVILGVMGYKLFIKK